MQTNFSFATVIRMKKKLNVCLDCYVLEAYSMIQNNQREKFDLIIFLQGVFALLQCL